MQLIYFRDYHYFSAQSPLTLMYLSHLGISIKIPSWKKLGSCILNHSSTDDTTSSLLWNVPRGNTSINRLTPNDPYSGRIAPLNSKRCILCIYSTNIGTDYFKHGIYSPFFPLQNSVCFIILTYLFPVLFTFYIQCVLKFKKIIPAPKG